MSIRASGNAVNNRDAPTKWKRRHNIHNRRNDGICSFFIQGHCKFGNGCKFLHQTPEGADADVQAGASSAQGSQMAVTVNAQVEKPSWASLISRCSHTPTASQHNFSSGSEQARASPAGVRRKNACYQWNSTGTCNKGDKCRYSHDPKIQDRISLRIKAEADAEAERRRIQSVEDEAARQALSEATQRALVSELMQQEFRRLEIAKEEAAKTIQHVVLDYTLVTFEAGLAIRRILTGFETCRVRIKNLPLDATYNEVATLFTQQGMDQEQFHIIGINKLPNGKQEADVVCQEDFKAIAIGLDGIEFRQENLHFEVYQNSSVDVMRVSAGGHSDVLTISWRAPSVGFVVTYSDRPQAEAKVRQLDKKICEGRKVKVEMNRPPPGQTLGQRSANAVTIRGLHPSVTDTQVAQFSGSTIIKRLKPTDYDTTQAPEYFRRHIEVITQGGLKLFETVVTDAADGKYTVRAHFYSWTQAKNVYNFLDNRRTWFIGNVAPWLRLADPLQYTITIPIQQYHAQKRRWDSLQVSVKDKGGCNLSINPKDRVSIIRVGGDDKKAIGMVKVRVENLAAGEKLEYWHHALGAGAGSQKFLDSVFEETGTYIRIDRRLRAAKAYGDPKNLEAARKMVESEIERLESLEQTVFLKRRSVGFLMRRGLATLEEELGKENVTLDISSSPCKIIIRGGESARHTLRRVIDESLDCLNSKTETTPDSNCPICYDEVSSPVQLACGHCYCTVCIRHFLASASDTKKFPLCCMGNETNCRIPFPIPVLQRFLPPQQFSHLLETVFVTHIERFPQEFKYCTTPDCRQVYRCSDNSSTASVLHCPSCLSAVCSSCLEEVHEGMTCAERKLHNDSAEQERLNEQLAIRSGFKRCPACKVWIQKIEGCNHMTCRCGAHICWVCMGIYSPETIYGHMTQAHGGIHENANAGNQNGVQVQHYDADEDDDAEYVLQVELLRQAAQLREQRQEQLRREEQLRRYQWQQLLERQVEARREAAARRQDIVRQMHIHEQETRTQKQDNSGWGCVIM